MEEYIQVSPLMNSSEARASLPTLHNDLVIHILLRLPVKSLCQFKCVSKSWCSLIDSPSFIKIKKNVKRLLMRHYMKPGDVLSFHDLDSEELNEVQPSIFIPLDPVDHRMDLSSLLGPCNGLLCIIGGDIEGNGRIILFNPTSIEFKHIPLCPFECPPDYLGYILGEGFGYSCSTNDFKVVLIRYVFEPENENVQPYLLVHLYTSSSNSWRLIDYRGTAHPKGYAHNNAGLLSHGFCHWHATNFEQSQPLMILCFDINNENFKELEYPDCVNGVENKWSTLTLRNECLTFIESKPLESKESYVIWVMKEYGVKSSWIKQFVVTSEVRLYPLCWMNDSCLFMEELSGGLAIFNLLTNEVKKFNVYWKALSSLVLIYEESLIGLNQLIKSS